jgi:hypothetical protein
MVTTDAMCWLTLLTTLPPPNRYRVAVRRTLPRMGAVRLGSAGWMTSPLERGMTIFAGLYLVSRHET